MLPPLLHREDRAVAEVVALEHRHLPGRQPLAREQPHLPSQLRTAVTRPTTGGRPPCANPTEYITYYSVCVRSQRHPGPFSVLTLVEGLHQS